MKPHYKSESTQLEHYQALRIEALLSEIQRLKDKYEPQTFRLQIDKVDINDPNFDLPIDNIMAHFD